MDVNNKDSNQNKQSTLEKCLIELRNAIKKDDTRGIQKSIIKTIKTIMKKNIVFDQHIEDLISLYMHCEQIKSKTAIEYLLNRFSVFAKICGNKTANSFYLKKMAISTSTKAICCLFMKIKDPKLEEEQILKKIEKNSLPYEIENKESNIQLSEELASADSILSNTISEYSNSID